MLAEHRSRHCSQKAQESEHEPDSQDLPTAAKGLPGTEDPADVRKQRNDRGRDSWLPAGCLYLIQLPRGALPSSSRALAEFPSLVGDVAQCKDKAVQEQHALCLQDAPICVIQSVCARQKGMGCTKHPVMQCRSTESIGPLSLNEVQIEKSGTTFLALQAATWGPWDALVREMAVSSCFHLCSSCSL